LVSTVYVLPSLPVLILSEVSLGLLSRPSSANVSMGISSIATTGDRCGFFASVDVVDSPVGSVLLEASGGEEDKGRGREKLATWWFSGVLGMDEEAERVA
jgi:hypothetical protein